MIVIDFLKKKKKKLWCMCVECSLSNHGVMCFGLTSLKNVCSMKNINTTEHKFWFILRYLILYLLYHYR